MRYKKKNEHANHAFTLVEILVVIVIIALLSTVGLVSYQSLVKQSRDERRKADLEQIRAAVEMWRNNNTNSSYPPLSVSCAGGSIAEGPNTYLSSIPTDPFCDARTYYYAPVDSAGGSCDGSSDDICASYTLGAALEIAGSECAAADACGLGISCSYCIGPHGIE